MIIYICGPLRGNTEEEELKNMENARVMQKTLMDLNVLTFLPHMMFYDMCHSSENRYDETSIMCACLQLVGRSNAVVVLQGWENSIGSKAELSYAKSLNLPVHLHTGNREELLQFVSDLHWSSKESQSL